MPVMNGLDAARAIRQLDHRNAGTRILAMTGMAFDEDRDNCFAAGMDDVVTKPFDLNDLRSRVEEIGNPDLTSVALSS
jgi:CheY-like chemotaxis protein